MVIHTTNNIYPLNEVRSPSTPYLSTPPELNSMSRLQHAFENHLAMYHYQQNALLSLLTEEIGSEDNEWQLGAHLTMIQLRQRSEELMTALAALKVDKET